jgi:hypothetical protein
MYIQALCDQLHDHETTAGQLLDYYDRRTQAFRTFADSLFALNDKTSGDESGATRYLS